ncbi:thioredoxin domain-containing protein [Candidatus Kaiserbacteria bacterium]|nr:thioredoxin domain-containing protein [Candidatus Kaiserbacteria bacterium]
MNKSSFAVPVAIVVAAALIAGAIYLNGRNKTPSTTVTPTKEEVTVRPIDDKDHVRGNPNAPIVVVEYSDYDCPFCSQFHTTMRRAIEKYGANGKVAWVYRHFPLKQLHPNAFKIAAASECVAEIGGNEAFWKFTDLVFDGKPIEQRKDPETGTMQDYLGFTDMGRLPEFAEQAGADRGRFELCFKSGKYDSTIDSAVTEAIAAGGEGTPHTLIVAGNEILTELPGAIPFENYRGRTGEMVSGLDEILANLTKQVPDQPTASDTTSAE